MRHRKSLIFPSHITLLALASFIANSAHAAVPEDRAALEEIVVTAQKRTENLQETPIAITAFNDEMIKDLGLVNLRSVGELVPNVRVLNLASTSVSAVATIRGLASAEPSLAQDPKVGFYLDGVYLAKNTGTIFDIVDLERIEVLRGPQGTLYGKNTTGGAINLISRKPSGELGFKQQVTVGDNDRLRIGTTLDLPEVADISAKIGYVQYEHDGFIENRNANGPKHIGSVDNDAWRLALRWVPSENFNANFSYQSSDTRAVPTAGQLSYVDPSFADYSVITSFSPFTVVPPAQNPFRQALDSGAVSKDHLGHLDLDGQGHEKYEITDSALHLSWMLGDLELRSITGYHDLDGGVMGSDQDGGAWSVPFAHFALTSGGGNVKSHTSWSQEFQIVGTSDDERWQYVSGLYYFEEEGEELHNDWKLLLLVPGGNIPGFPDGVLVDAYTLLGPPPASLGEDYRIENESWAAYSQVTWTPPVLEDRMDVTLGLRYTQDDKKATILDATPNWVESESWSKFSPTGTVSYRFSDYVNGFFKVATGYNAGSFPVRAGNQTAFSLAADEETVIDYELGLKSELFDNRLRLNVAGFWYDYKDMQVNDFQAGATILRNAGTATVRGIELEGTARLTEALTVGLDYGYLDFKYDEFVVGGVDLSSEAKPAFAPKNTLHGSITYIWPLQLGELKARIDATYTDEYHFNPLLYKHDAADSHTLVDARIRWTDIPLPAGSLELAVWGQNLTDEVYRDFGTDFGELGFSTNTFGDLRTWGVDFIYTY